jgi:hypothetical protein
VSANDAEPDTPETVALTLYGPPETLLAVKMPEEATPDALVEMVMLMSPFENVPLAPLEGGAVNVTATPLTRLP